MPKKPKSTSPQPTPDPRWQTISSLEAFVIEKRLTREEMYRFVRNTIKDTIQSEMNALKKQANELCASPEVWAEFAKVAAKRGAVLKVRPGWRDPRLTEVEFSSFTVSTETLPPKLRAAMAEVNKLSARIEQLESERRKLDEREKDGVAVAFDVLLAQAPWAEKLRAEVDGLVAAVRETIAKTGKLPKGK